MDRSRRRWCVLAWSTYRSGSWRERSGGAFVLCTGTAYRGAAMLAGLQRAPVWRPAGLHPRALLGTGHRCPHQRAWRRALSRLAQPGHRSALLPQSRGARCNHTLAGRPRPARAPLRAQPLRCAHDGPCLAPFCSSGSRVPFYVYSVAYGSVPIFLPRWYPHGWYNTRYGMELLPVFALGLTFCAAAAEERLRATVSTSRSACLFAHRPAYRFEQLRLSCVKGRSSWAKLSSTPKPGSLSSPAWPPPWTGSLPPG